ncbi:MAG: DEAD/DEAH box helicase family protein [Carboxylicivirga sp.]|jgi:hypothetical protein|nr:DEAD/DEAH box helicase family protein [Carboxylicivirga sp.]
MKAIDVLKDVERFNKTKPTKEEQEYADRLFEIMNLPISVCWAKGESEEIQESRFGNFISKIANETTRQRINAIRKIPSKNYRSSEKCDYTIMGLLGGKFKAQNDASLIKPSLLYVIDLDGVDGTEVQEVYKESITIRPNIRKVLKDYLLCDFITASGGCKLIFRSDFQTTKPKEFQAKWNAFNKEIKAEFNKNGIVLKNLKFDDNVSNLSRGQFISSDADMYFNPMVKKYPVSQLKTTMPKPNIGEPNFTEETVYHPNASSSYPTDITNASYNKIILELIYKYYNQSDELRERFISVLFKDSTRNNMLAIMAALQNSLPQNDAKDIGKRIFKMHPKYNSVVFEKNWKYMNKPQADFSFLLSCAHKAGFDFQTKSNNEVIKQCFEIAKMWKDKTPPKKPDIKINQYLSEKLDEIYKEIKRHSRLMIVSHTGSGKTKFFIKYLRQKYKRKIIFVVPFVTLAKQIEKEGIPTIYDGSNTEIAELPYKDTDIMCATYESVCALNLVLSEKDFDEYLFVIDELHAPLPSVPIRESAVKDMFDMARNFKSVIGLSGTPHNDSIMALSDFLCDFKRVTVDTKDKLIHELYFIPAKNIPQSIFDHTQHYFKGGKNFNKLIGVYYNDKEELKKLHSKWDIEGLENYLITSETKNSRAVSDAVEKERIPSNVRIYASTSAGRDGFSLDNENIEELHIALFQPTADVKQWVSRGRFPNVKKVFIHYEEKMDFRFDNCYSPQYLFERKKKESEMVVEKVNTLDIPYYLKAHGEMPSDKTIDGYINDANNRLYNRRRNLAIKLNEDANSVGIINHGLVYEVIEEIQKAEKTNPLIFASQFIDYGFKYKDYQPIGQEEPKDNWKEAQEFFGRFPIACKDANDYYRNLNKLKSNLSIKKTYEVDDKVAKNIKVIADRIRSFTDAGCNIEDAFRDVVGFKEHATTYMQELNRLKFHGARLKGCFSKYPLFIELDKLIEFGGEYVRVDKIERIVKDAEFFSQAKADKDLGAELRKYYNVLKKRDAKNGNKMKYKILGYVQPKGLPKVDLVKYHKKAS